MTLRLSASEARMRVATALALALGCGAAFAGDPEEMARELIEQFRTQQSKEEMEVRFSPPPWPGDRGMTCEFWWERELGPDLFDIVSFVPRGDDVEVLELRMQVCEPRFEGVAGPWELPVLRRASLPKEAFVELGSAAQVVAQAWLTPRARPVNAVPKPSMRGVGEGVLRLRMDEILEGRGVILVENWVLGLIGAEIDETAKVQMCRTLLERALEGLDWKPVQPVESIADRLRAELATTRGWRREIRAAFLGWLGSADDAGALRAIEPSTPVIERAILQLEAVGSALKDEAGVEALLALADSRDYGLRRWAQLVAGERFKPAYQRKLERVYATSGDWEVRQAALEEYERVDPGEIRLLKLALADPVAEIRASAGARLNDATVLLPLAVDKKLVQDSDYLARIIAIRALGDLPVQTREVAGAALLGILDDTRDDCEVRKRAAEAMGHLGFHEAIPELIRLLKKPPPRRPISLRDPKPIDGDAYRLMFDIRYGIIRALGLLRAKEAVVTIMEILDQAIEEEDLGDGGLPATSGEALARIGDPAARPVLQRALAVCKPEDRESWESRLRLLQAIELRVGPEILLQSQGSCRIDLSGSDYAGERFWVRLLADVVDKKELMWMAEKCAAEGDSSESLVRAAIELQSGR